MPLGRSRCFNRNFSPIPLSSKPFLVRRPGLPLAAPRCSHLPVSLLASPRFGFPLTCQVSDLATGQRHSSIKFVTIVNLDGFINGSNEVRPEWLLFQVPDKLWRVHPGAVRLDSWRLNKDLAAGGSHAIKFVTNASFSIPLRFLESIAAQARKVVDSSVAQRAGCNGNWKVRTDGIFGPAQTRPLHDSRTVLLLGKKPIGTATIGSPALASSSEAQSVGSINASRLLAFKAPKTLPSPPR